MKKVLLHQLKISNFKGLKDLTINFHDDVTSIFADNGLGKTTILDAFIWLLFNKDSQDRKEFDIKNTKFPELNRGDHEVSATITIDGFNHVNIKHVYREKWTKKRGEQFAELTGHEHLFFWNDVPVSQSEYKEKIEAYFVDEETFKLIAISGYFTSLNWKKQRAILIGMAGTVSDLELASENAEFNSLAQPLALKTLDEYKREIVLNKKKVKSELDHIPSRIDEVQKNMPLPEDWNELQARIDHQTRVIIRLENAKSDMSEAYNQQFEMVKTRQGSINSLKIKVQGLINEIKLTESKKESDRTIKGHQLQDKLQNLLTDIKSKTALLNSKLSYLETKRSYTAEVQSRLETMRKTWHSINERTFSFDESTCTCPTCQRLLDTNDIESKKQELIKNFNTEKSNALADLVAKSNDVKATDAQNAKEIQESEKMIESLRISITALEVEKSNLEQDLDLFKRAGGQPVDLQELIDHNVEIRAVKDEIKALEDSMPLIEKPNTLQVDSDIISAKSEIDTLKKELGKRESIERSEKRIEELKEDERRYSQQLADLEGIEFLIDKFNKFKIDSIEGEINGMFKYVTFKMFDQQVNRAEVETCEVMVDNVPFSVLNNAARINAGIDIINVLSAHYGIASPVFIDNAESITHIIDTPSQLIRLVVSEVDKSLRVA